MSSTKRYLLLCAGGWEIFRFFLLFGLIAPVFFQVKTDPALFPFILWTASIQLFIPVGLFSIFFYPEKCFTLLPFLRFGKGILSCSSLVFLFSPSFFSRLIAALQNSTPNYTMAALLLVIFFDLLFFLFLLFFKLTEGSEPPLIR